ncbi:radical SAM family heme chaperone HemW [Plebeiibacterium marinum]|uniref:Heme chaperone HemW n=1 Tax=Plebeiibacterium marinum TaxID=2992111 RepID=A0AAE3SKL6_9BACT|nr:radical SAM family heme chaperone HemW [Plebeiobacterium marinum]MCW3806990.1 radical SAM family heme chaperone HemW [Plebeiobacterium marinum]
MAGIYFHIPFCIKKCGYCDFYSITDISFKKQFIDAVKKEILQRKEEIISNGADTIYFGGGTPSLLSKNDFEAIFSEIFKYVDKSRVVEMTVEVNPDDVTKEYLTDLLEVGFNRLSIGTQSFDDGVLNFMNRRHSALQARETVSLAQKVGYSNISIDLIYGVPGLNLDSWKKTVNTALMLNVQHISAYHLTFETGTPFYQKLKRGEIAELSDNDSLQQYSYLIKELNSKGFVDYEISNFAVSGFESKHNSSYWTGKDYIGIGPAAHSLYGNIRRWNVSSIKDYIYGLFNNADYFTEEYLSEKDRYNEVVMLSLRTRKGLCISSLKELFNEHIWQHFYKELEIQLRNKNVIMEQGFIMVSDDKKMITDQIISDFFMI